MSTLAARFYGVVLATVLLWLLLVAGGCAAAYEVPAATAGPLDSTLCAAGLSPRKVKFTGPVTLQMGGAGNMATTIGKAKAPLATATDASRKGGLPWWVFAGIGLASIAAWEWLTKQLAPLSWLPWRKI